MQQIWRQPGRSVALATAPSTRLETETEAEVATTSHTGSRAPHAPHKPGYRRVLDYCVVWYASPQTKHAGALGHCVISPHNLALALDRRVLGIPHKLTWLQFSMSQRAAQRKYGV